MRTKLFIAFLFVILVALVSNLLFEQFIMDDFEEYMRGMREDHLYWVLAAIEGSYQDNAWNMDTLSDTLHWGMMLGFDMQVEDSSGREIINSRMVMTSLPLPMKRRMESLIHPHPAEGEYEKYPLFMEGTELGMLHVRQLKREGPAAVKEVLFQRRGKYFLVISFLIAGLSAVVMAVFFSLYLSRPIRKLQAAAEKVARSDFSVRVHPVSHDEIGRLSDRFNFMVEALEKEELLRKRLTTNIAHELRTPLAVMRGQVEGMIDGVVADSQEGLENIRIEVERLTRLVEGVEDLVKAEASFITRSEEAFLDLKEFLGGIAFAMGPIFREKGLSFSLADRGPLEVKTDEDKLDRIIKNILSNALKFTKQGSVAIDYGTRGKEYFIEVADTGEGIPDDERSNIFMRFYRGRNAIDSGVGVGLAIVKELVDVMAGRIEVESAAGKGSVFRVFFPLKS